MEVVAMKIKREDLYKKKGNIELEVPFEIKKAPEDWNDELKVILADALTKKYLGGDNA